MRTFLIFALILAGTSADLRAVPDRMTGKELVRAEKRNLQGQWVMVRWQRAGSVVVYNASEKFYVWTIRGDTLTAKQGALGWEIVAALTLNPNTEPRAMDAIELAGPNQGKTGRYLYHLEGETLTVCYGGLGQPRPKDFTGQEAANQVVLVFTKLKS